MDHLSREKEHGFDSQRTAVSNHRGNNGFESQGEQQFRITGGKMVSNHRWNSCFESQGGKRF